MPKVNRIDYRLQEANIGIDCLYQALTISDCLSRALQRARAVSM